MLKTTLYTILLLLSGVFLLSACATSEYYQQQDSQALAVPASPTDYLQLGISKQNAGNHEGAVEDFTAALQTEGISPGKAADICLRRAASLDAVGRYAEAIDDYLKVLAYRPSNTDAYQKLVALLLDCPDESFRDTAKALEYADKAARMDPELTRLWARAARRALDEASGNDDMTIKAATAMLDNADRLGQQALLDARYLRAASLNALGRYSEAVSDYREILAADPGHADAMSDLAILLATCEDESLRDYAQAVELADKAIDLDPSGADSLFVVYESAREHDFNSGLYSEVIGLEMRNLEKGFSQKNLAISNYWIGVSWRKLDKHGNAVEYFTKAIDMMRKGGFPDEELAIVLFIRGRSLEALGRKDDAIKDYEAAIEANPGYSQAYVYCSLIMPPGDAKAIEYIDLAVNMDESEFSSQARGRVYRNAITHAYDEGNYPLAMSLSNRAIATANGFLKEDLANAYCIRGKYWSDIDRSSVGYGAAIADFRTSVQLSPSYRALNNLAWVLATCPYEEHRDAEGGEAVGFATMAMQMLTEQGNASPEILAEAYDTLAAAYANMGKTDAVGMERNAIAQLETAIGILENSSGAQLSTLSEFNGRLESYNDRLEDFYRKGLPWREKAKE